MTDWRDVDGPEGFDARVVEIVVYGPPMHPLPKADGSWEPSEQSRGWFMFLHPAGSSYWLCGGAIAEGDPPESIELDEQKRQGTVKLCALLGLSWEEIEAQPARSAAWQLECMRKLGPRMKAKLRGSSAEEIAEWRGQVVTLEPGEVLREQLLGEDPLAGRN